MRLSVRAFVFLPAAALAPSACACGICAFASFWDALPPVVPWSILAVVWFVVAAIISAISKVRFTGIPKVYFALPLALGGSMLSAWMLGPLTTLPFAFPAFAASVDVWARTPKKPRKRWGVRAMRVVGVVFLGLFALTGYLETVKAAGMDEADRIIMWSGTGTGRAKLYRLEKEEPESLPVYREILRRGKSYELGLVARRVAVIGSATEDVPLLIDALERTQRNAPGNFWEDDVQGALRQISGLDPPGEPGPGVWRTLWQASATREATPASVQ